MAKPGDGTSRDPIERITAFLADRIDRLTSMALRSAAKTIRDETPAIPIRTLQQNTGTDKEAVAKLLKEELGL